MRAAQYTDTASADPVTASTVHGTLLGDGFGA